MITWTAEVAPYAGLSLLVAISSFLVTLISVSLRKPTTFFVSFALFLGALGFTLFNPYTYQASGELEAMDARVSSVNEKGGYSFSNGAELSGSYKLGETIRLLCVPSPVECVPDDGGLRNAKKLKWGIYNSAAEERGARLPFAYGLSLERHADAD